MTRIILEAAASVYCVTGAWIARPVWDGFDTSPLAEAQRRHSGTSGRLESTLFTAAFWPAAVIYTATHRRPRTES